MHLDFVKIIFGPPHPMGGKREEVGRKIVHSLRVNQDLGHAAAYIPQRGCQVEYLGARYRVLEIVWKYATSHDHRVVVELDELN